MKDKIIMLVIGILIGAIIASAGFLIFGGNKKGRGDFDPSKFKDGNMTPPNFSRDGGDFDFNNIDSNNLPEKSTEKTTEWEITIYQDINNILVLLTNL